MNAPVPSSRTGDTPADNLLEESILPTWITQRPISLWGFVGIWIGLAVVIATFQYGANGITGGVSLPLGPCR
ncbi:hypothetical protein [Nocardiopsis alba]|uniref:hypothetical protein n=1 Tax=Nocardiopsis alba TaxID=53437 RepID=UPI0002EE3D51|nr:hypothetical protein [Nocardiopsis alba]